ncbi:RelA/SpoT domain-containing protein [Maridesulfovibrio sp.]|uniref:RelA/SpoT domain-containing protein n=1 Tax=Maridesulfovibrio sp. TaxID=2795000 RepID=UPI002AA7E1A3|nr:RelA/SpoT domain-containing protein [Maridesulfovibrio sp.]
MKISKTKIDKSGLALSKDVYKDEVDYIALEDIFDEYRKRHLGPLTEISMDLQRWLADYECEFYIAQRLKRKPQIISKLQRLHVRLTQLQDIGGARIVVEDNDQVEKIYSYLRDELRKQDKISVIRVKDYREKGRDTTGYRALHVILSLDGVFIELQIRSRIQHYWSELIERTSVVYGFTLKEQKGDPEVIYYFQQLSSAFYEIESGRDITSSMQIGLEEFRKKAEEIIQSSDNKRIFDSFIHDDILKTMASREKSRGVGFKNWLMIFDWNSGSFIDWSDVGRDIDEAVNTYVKAESQYNQGEGFEVVLIGSSSVATIRQTHSHYFGITHGDNILENLSESVLGFSSKMDIDTGARRILLVLSRRKHWGSKIITIPTLKNHFCNNVLTFDSSLEALAEKELITYANSKTSVSLNIGQKAQIESYL